jgi:hypothetical protein
MENKHKKSKRSLNGDDVYELACRYDVGWSKSKSRKRRKDGEINDEKSDEGGKNVSSMVKVRKGQKGQKTSIPPPRRNLKVNSLYALSEMAIISKKNPPPPPVWKVCIARRISPARNFDAFYIFTIKFSKSPARNFQTFQSGPPWTSIGYFEATRGYVIYSPRCAVPR